MRPALPWWMRPPTWRRALRICSRFAPRWPTTGSRLCSATVDGNRHLLRILRQVWPTIVIQRCLVHIQRQGLSWCRQSPKRPAPARLVSPRHGDPHRGRAGSVHRSGAGLGGAVRAAPGTPGRTGTRVQRSQTGPEYVTRRLAKHVSRSRRSRDPEIHQRLRGIFRPTQTQVSATPRAGTASSECLFAMVCLSLPSLKTNSFWHLFPE